MASRRGGGARDRVACWIVCAAWLGASPGWASAQERRVSLADVLEHADEHAPLVVVARARLGEGEAEREGAEPLLRSPLAVEIMGGPRSADGFQSADTDLLIALRQPVEIAGQRGARLDHAAALGAQRAAQLDEVRWEVHRQVHFAFHESIEMRVRREAAVRWRDVAASLLEIARRRESLGDVGPIDVMLAEAELSRAEQELVAARHAYEAAMLTVSELSGWPSSDPPHPAGELDAPLPIAPEGALVARALEQHPALAAREAAIREAEARARLADREAWPSLDVGIALSREGATGGSPANYIGLVTIGFALPIWQQNALERARARASIVVAEADLDAERGAIEARVRRARAAAVAAAERVAIHQREVVPRFERYLESISRAYELGEIDAIAVSTARRQLLDAEREALAAFAEYHRALADLEAEVGAEVVLDTHHEGEGAR